MAIISFDTRGSILPGQRIMPAVRIEPLRSLKAVFNTAGVRDAHSHRFRHTLATEILAEGGTIQDVADVLGIGAHIATKHYAKWNLAREERIIRLMQAVHGHVYELVTEGERAGQVQ